MRTRIVFKIPIVIFYLLIFLVIMPLLIVFNRNSLHSFYMITIPWIIMGISIIRILYELFSKCSSLLVITFYLFIYVWLGLSAFAQSYSNNFPWSGTYSEYEQFKAQLCILIGIGAYEIAFFYGRKRKKLNQYNTMVFMSFSPSRVAIFSSIAIIASVIIVQVMGGISVFFSTRYAFKMLLLDRFDSASGLLIQSFIRVAPYVTLVSAIYCLKKEKRSFYYLLWLVLILFLVVVNFFMNNPTIHTRAWIGVIILGLSLSIIELKSYLARSSFWAIFLITLVILFPIADYFRSDINSSKKLDIIDINSSFISNGDYDAFQQIMNGMNMVDREGPDFGRNLIGVILFWVPRFLWSDKPIGTGVEIAEFSNYSFTNLSAPLWVEGYRAFSWTGVFLLLGILGYFTGVIDNKLSKNMEIISAANFVVPSIAAYQIFFLRGDLLGAFPHGCVLILGFFIVLKFNKIYSNSA